MQVSVANLDELNSLMSRTFSPVRHDPLGPAVGAHIRALRLTPDVEIVAIDCPALVVHRTPQLISQASEDRIVLNIDTRFGSVMQDDRSCEFGPGDGVLVDTTRPFAMRFPRGTHAIAVQVDRRALVAVAGTRIPAGVPIPGTSALMRVLTRNLQETLLASEAIVMAEREALAHVTLDLIAAAVRLFVADEGKDTDPAGRQALRAKLQHDISERLADPDLSPTDLAERHHISVRYVHALFEDLGVPPAAYIRELRLQQAFRLLADPRRRGVSIVRIANSVGFTDPTTFVRAFRRRFGMAPSDRRAAAVPAAVTPARSVWLPQPSPPGWAAAAMD